MFFSGPPRIPQEQPYISELSPNSVHLQWRAVQLPSRITDYAPVSYRLEIQELPRSDWVILADGIPHTDFHVINLQPDKEYNFRVRAVNKYGCSEPTSLVQLRRRAGKFSLYAEKYVNDQIVMMSEIFVIYVLGHLKKNSGSQTMDLKKRAR